MKNEVSQFPKVIILALMPRLKSRCCKAAVIGILRLFKYIFLSYFCMDTVCCHKSQYDRSSYFGGQLELRKASIL